MIRAARAPLGRPGRLSRPTAGLVMAAAAGVLLAALISLIHLPYAIMAPGPVENILGAPGNEHEVTKDGATVEVDGLISVAGAPVYPTDGALYFTTVSLRGGPGAEVNVWDYLGAKLDSNKVILPIDAVFPKGATKDQITQENAAEMSASQADAVAAALSALGKPVTPVVKLASVEPDSGFAESLKAGDILTEIQGRPISTVAQIRPALDGATAGTQVSVGITRDGVASTVTGKLIDRQGIPVLGVTVTPAYTSPITVTISAGNVGGPSAGMMFALAVYDVLTPGELTGGQQIAGTGTISADGAVGPIGGIAQKIAGASRAGARYFLAPADNCAEAMVAHAGEMQIIRVENLDQAVADVTAIAAGKAAGLPTCQAG